MEKESISQHEKYEDDLDISLQNGDKKSINIKRMDNGANPDDTKISLVAQNAEAPVRNFDLNVDLNENADSGAIPAGTPSTSSAKPPIEVRPEEYPGWSLADMESMAIDPVQLAKLNQRIDEEQEDYDEEG